MIILMEKRIWRLEEGYVQTRVSSPMQSVTHLRAYLDEKGFKTATIDDNLAIAGELTWQEVVEPIEGFYKGKADVYPF